MTLRELEEKIDAMDRYQRADVLTPGMQVKISEGKVEPGWWTIEDVQEELYSLLRSEQIGVFYGIEDRMFSAVFYPEENVKEMNKVAESLKGIVEHSLK